MDNMVFAYILIGLGLVFLAAELFLPTHGILPVFGVGALVVGVAMTFSTENKTQGIITVIAVFLILMVMVPALFHIWPKTPMGKRFFLTGPDEDSTMARMPTNLELEQLRGRYGQTVSALRPAGITDFDGKRVDTLSEGVLIEPGRWVKCIDVRAGRVLVRQVEKPPDLGDVGADL
jgi:membrane-bound ClpP family serine protease